MECQRIPPTKEQEAFAEYLYCIASTLEEIRREMELARESQHAVPKDNLAQIRLDYMLTRRADGSRDKIHAIKRLRGMLGISLREAKDLVDSW